MAPKRGAKPRMPEAPPPPGPVIVGIGSSAGGLEALEQFLARVPKASGLAFVIVQHLDPTHKDLMVELLQRIAPVPVVQITDRLKVAPDHVYIIPPNQDLSILHGVLHLLQPTAPRGLRLPVDAFFRSLAVDQGPRSIGVILSGMGSDGTQGARAIKGEGGAVFTQAGAKFDGMPRSAADAGLSDLAAPAGELPARILAYVHHAPLLEGGAAPGPEGRDASGLEKVILLLRARTGHDFTFYKKSTLYRRIERRMALHQLPRIADYVRCLRESPQETDLLFRELLIGVTAFFRDPGVWDRLGEEVLPPLLASRGEGRALRAWCPGCSTGEEAYSLAIAFREAAERLGGDVPFTLNIFATDLDKDAIARARAGTYPAGAVEGVSPARLARFFVQDEGGYTVTKEIRGMVIFAPQNLVMDPPFTRLDLLVCRNLLIYLEGSLQRRILPLFHYSLNPGGILVLGSSESVGQDTGLFSPLDGKMKIFKRKDGALRPDQVSFPSSFILPPPPGPEAAAGAPPPPPRSAVDLQALTDGLLLQHYAPAAVLTTAEGDIVFFSGRTGKYLEPPAGKANLNIFAMAREGLGGALGEALPRAVRSQEAVTLQGLRVGPGPDGPCVDVRVHPLAEPPGLRGMLLVVFTEAPEKVLPGRAGRAGSASRMEARNAALALELQHAREELHAVRDEMQSSQEELKAANEELQSTNEELQSTNEELTTSKEEMQSMNEELQTINHELQSKVGELSLSRDDMNNLLNSTDIATLFLDGELNVRRYTPQTTHLIKLIPGDAGRPITDLVTSLDYPGLADDAREVLRALRPQERQVPARDGQWVLVRIMPYRTQDNHIDGVVITFVDITKSKVLEASLREALAVLETRVSEQALEQEKLETLERALRQGERTMDPPAEAAVTVRAGPRGKAVRAR